MMRKSDNGQYRNSGQFLMPPKATCPEKGKYDIYPALDLGPDKIHFSAEDFAERVGPVPILLIDGVEGVFWDLIEDHLTRAYARQGRNLSFVETSSFFKDEEELRELVSPFLNGDDPVFGRVTTLRLEDWFSRIPVLTPLEGVTTVVIGPGASFFHPDAPLAFVELPKNEFLFRLRADTTSCLGFSAHWDKKQMYKQAFFVDWEVLGALRLSLGKKLGLIDEKRFDFLWIVDFPLFEWSDEQERYLAMHHPFTMPFAEDVELMNTDDKGRARAEAYDIVLNGTELGGGSVRIHQNDVQEKMFTALGFTVEEAHDRFGFLLDAFQYGVPPHAGLAYGLDRLIMLMVGADSIRDVIAFPKVKDASDLMTDAPTAVDDAQLAELGLTVVQEEGSH